MLKRHQVLLNDWLVDHIKAVSKKYDVSFSEVIRMLLCIQFGQFVSEAYPKYKYKITNKKIGELIRKRNRHGELDSEDLHKSISNIYFETRKALEYWAEQEKKRKK